MTNIAFAFSLSRPDGSPSPLPRRAVRIRRMVLNAPELTREEVGAVVRLAECARPGPAQQAFHPEVPLPENAGAVAWRAEAAPRKAGASRWAPCDAPIVRAGRRPHHQRDALPGAQEPAVGFLRRPARAHHWRQPEERGWTGRQGRPLTRRAPCDCTVQSTEVVADEHIDASMRPADPTRGCPSVSPRRFLCVHHPRCRRSCPVGRHVDGRHPFTGPCLNAP